MLEKDITKAFIYSYKEQAETLFQNYLDHAEAYVTKTKVRDPNTREELQPDEAFLKSIEEQIAIIGSAADGFRQEVIAYLWAATRRGERISYIAYEPLKEAIERKLMNSVRELSPDHHQGAHARRGAAAEIRRHGPEPDRERLSRGQHRHDPQVRRQPPLARLSRAPGRRLSEPWRSSGPSRPRTRCARTAAPATGSAIARSCARRSGTTSPTSSRKSRSSAATATGSSRSRSAASRNTASSTATTSPRPAPATATPSRGRSSARRRRTATAAGRAGDQPGVDYYETDVTLEELIEIMFEDLELPDMERKILREVMSERIAKRKGYRRVGVRVHLDRRRTAKSRLRRKVATGGPSELPPLASKRPDAALQDDAEPERFPFRREDLTYKRLIEDTPRGIERRRDLHHGHLGVHGHHEEVPGAQLLLPAVSVRQHQVPERRARLHRPPHRGARGHRGRVLPQGRVGRHADLLGLQQGAGDHPGPLPSVACGTCTRSIARTATTSIPTTPTR